MKKTIVTFGLISGAISSVTMVVSIPIAHRIGFDKGPYVGYTGIVLSFLLVFFGIRSYRDNVGNGQITFTKAFALGLSITLLSCLCYIATWEVLYYTVFPNFWDTYGGHLVEKLKASGASPAAVQAKVQEVAKYKELYKNPFINAALTFIEPFPIGLVITLFSAAVLRKKPASHPSRSPVPAS
jgi:ABC-type microcin C transport system permease subunit YejB